MTCVFFKMIGMLLCKKDAQRTEASFQNMVESMKAFDWLFHCFLRLRYPVSLPEDIATDLGISASNFLTFNEFVFHLTNLSCRPKRLTRFMPRDQAEAAFQSAQRKECFGRNSLYSYYFHEGWLEFSLYFDEHSRLRRIYMQHKHLTCEQGIEIPLNCENALVLQRIDQEGLT